MTTLEVANEATMVLKGAVIRKWCLAVLQRLARDLRAAADTGHELPEETLKAARDFLGFSLGAEAQFAGILKGGEFIADLDHWAIYKREHEGKRIILTADLERQRRTLKQNRRFFKAILPEAITILSRPLVAAGDLPLSKDLVFNRLKASFIGTIETELGPVPKRSSKLDVKEFQAFTEAVEAWLLHSHGLVIPEQGDDW